MHRPTVTAHQDTPASLGRSLGLRLAIAGVLLATLVAILATVAPMSSAATDPGVALYTYLHAHGATMPPSWAQVVDARHASACTEYARDYRDYPAAYVDEFGVNATLAHAAVAATGFCS